MSTSLFGGDDSQTVRWPDISSRSSSSSSSTHIDPSPSPHNGGTTDSDATTTSHPTTVIASSPTTNSPPTSILHRLPPELRHQIYLHLLPTSPVIPSHPIRLDHASYPSTPPSSLSSSASFPQSALSNGSPTSSSASSSGTQSPTSGSLSLAPTHPLFAAELSHLLYTRPIYSVSITPSGIRALRGQALTYPEWDFGIRGGPVKIHSRDHDYHTSEEGDQWDEDGKTSQNPGIGLRTWIQRVEKLEIAVQIWAQPGLSTRMGDYVHWFVDWVRAVRGSSPHDQDGNTASGTASRGQVRPFKSLKIETEWCGWEGMVAEEERAGFGSGRGFEGQTVGAEVAERVLGSLGDLRAERVSWGGVGSGEGEHEMAGEWEDLRTRLGERILGRMGEVGNRKTLERVFKERKERERDEWVGSAGRLGWSGREA